MCTFPFSHLVLVFSGQRAGRGGWVDWWGGGRPLSLLRSPTANLPNSCPSFYFHAPWCHRRSLKTKNRIRVTSLSGRVTEILYRMSKIVFPPEFWIPLVHSFPIMYDTTGSKVDGLAVRDHFLPKKGQTFRQARFWID